MNTQNSQTQTTSLAQALASLDRAVKETQNRNEAQKAYRTALNENIELTKKLQRALLDAPATGNWAAAGTQKHYNEMLKSLLDEIKGTGEFAK